MFHCLALCSFINRLCGLFVSFMGSPLRFNKSLLKSAFVSVFFLSHRYGQAVPCSSCTVLKLYRAQAVPCSSCTVLKLYRAQAQRRLSLHHKIQESLYRISDTDIAKEPLHHVIQRND
nr:MAG TPA: hypothetical protein [Caudoviricetes sp.]